MTTAFDDEKAATELREYVERQQDVIRGARKWLEQPDINPINREGLRHVIAGCEDRIRRLTVDAPRVVSLEPDDFEARIKRLNGESNGD